MLPASRHAVRFFAYQGRDRIGSVPQALGGHFSRKMYRLLTAIVQVSLLAQRCLKQANNNLDC